MFSSNHTSNAQIKSFLITEIILFIISEPQNVTKYIKQLKTWWIQIVHYDWQQKTQWHLIYNNTV